MIPFLIAGVVIAAWCLLAALLGDDTVTIQPEQPRPHGTCHVRGCGVRSYERVVRHDSGTPEWTCQQCRYEGAVLGYWNGEVAS